MHRIKYSNPISKLSCYTGAVFYLIFVVALFSLSQLSAQGRGKGKYVPFEKPPVASTGDTVDTAGAAAVVTPKPETWNPEIGILGTVGLPLSDTAQLLNLGFGGRLDITTHMPALKFLKQGGFEIRPGFFAGAVFHSVKSSTKTGNFFAAPGVIYAEVDLISVSQSVTPYFALGGGVSMASASTTTTATGESKSINSIDATLYSALGAKVYFGEEKRIFVKAEAAFYMIFEEVNGMFLQGNVGVGYKL